MDKYIGYGYYGREVISEAIRKINVHHFAGKLIVISETLEVGQKNLMCAEWELQPIKAHLGGTWQGYYEAGDQWINEAQSLGGHKIYLA
jgi:hypothetical protein